MKIYDHYIANKKNKWTKKSTFKKTLVLQSLV